MEGSPTRTGPHLAPWAPSVVLAEVGASDTLLTGGGKSREAGRAEAGVSFPPTSPRPPLNPHGHLPRLRVSGGARPALYVCLSPSATFRNGGHPNHHCSKATRVPAPDTLGWFAGLLHVHIRSGTCPGAMPHKPALQGPQTAGAPPRSPLGLPEGQRSEAREGWKWGVTPTICHPTRQIPAPEMWPGAQPDGGMCRVSRPARQGWGGGGELRGLGADPASPPQSPTHSPPDNREAQA